MKRIAFINGTITYVPDFNLSCWAAPLFPAFRAYAPKTELSYTLKKAENSLVFQVNGQSDDITAFLQKNHYRAKNGLLISSDQYPEFKDSRNTIYLQGSNKGKSAKLDVTRFVGNMQRDAKAEMIHEALAEFVDYIKSLKSAWILV